MNDEVFKLRTNQETSLSWQRGWLCAWRHEHRQLEPFGHHRGPECLWRLVSTHLMVRNSHGLLLRPWMSLMARAW